MTLLSLVKCLQESEKAPSQQAQAGLGDEFGCQAGHEFSQLRLIVTGLGIQGCYPLSRLAHDMELDPELMWPLPSNAQAKAAFDQSFPGVKAPTCLQEARS